MAKKPPKDFTIKVPRVKGAKSPDVLSQINRALQEQGPTDMLENFNTITIQSSGPDLGPTAQTGPEPQGPAKKAKKPKKNA